MLTSISADIMEKLKILSDAAKFDVASCQQTVISEFTERNQIIAF